MQANRNGFLYVLDRTDGKLLLAKPLVKKLTWAKEIGPDGRPVLNPNQTPTPEGTLICPAVDGATNFFSTSYNPADGSLLREYSRKMRHLHQNTAAEWRAGRGYMAAAAGEPRTKRRSKFCARFDIQTGKTVWELPQEGQGDSWGGILSTAGGLVFFGDDGGDLAAADAATGKQLWSFPFTESLHTSPMTYMFDNHQYVGMVVGSVGVRFRARRVDRKPILGGAGFSLSIRAQLGLSSLQPRCVERGPRPWH